jgi:hypothetical protein
MGAVKKGMALVCVFLFAGAMAWASQEKPAAKHPAKTKKPAIHHVVGKIVSVSGDSLVVSHGRGKMMKESTFMMNPETTKKGEPAEGDRVKVSYRMEGKEMMATHVTVLPKKMHKTKMKKEAKPAA